MKKTLQKVIKRYCGEDAICKKWIKEVIENICL
jgi:hypothetical protein